MAKEYEGSATGGSFSPNKTLRLAEGSKENDARIMSSLRDYQQIQNTNNQTIVDDYEKDKQGLRDLAKFSTTLTDRLVKDSQQRNLEEYEAGVADAYLNGIPQAEAEAFDKEEAAVNAVGMETDALGAEYAAASGSEALGERISSSSGWRALGRATGMAKQGAAQYGMHMAMNANRLAETTSPEQYAQVLNEVRREYTSRFSGMNRAMMAKYMFPKMQELETSAFLGWQEKNNELIKSERVSEMGATFYAEVANGSGGQAAVDFITKNRAFLGGWGKARVKLFELIDDGIESGDISPTDLESIKTQPYNFNGKETTLGRQFARDFKNTEQKFINRTNQEFRNEEDARKIKANEVVKKIREYQDGLGRKMTEDEKARIQKEWPSALGPIPNEIKDILTIEDQEETSRLEALKAKIQSNAQITEQDLIGIPADQRQQYKGFISPAVTEKRTEGKKIIESFVTNSIEGQTGATDKSPAWQKKNLNAQRRFNQLYSQYIAGGASADQALDQAITQVGQEITSGRITDQIDRSGATKSYEDVNDGMKALSKDPELWRTGTLPGSEQALKELNQQIESSQATGKTITIPQYYHTLASSLKGVSGWDLANQQSLLNGGSGLQKPQAEQYIDGLSDATIKEWMTYKPTPSRTMRTITATGDAASFLDFVAAPESGGDYNAFNLGGSNKGRVAYGSGFTGDGAQRWGRELTQMTVGEVMEIGASPSAENRWVWAAGRYQIIPDTLRGLVRNHNIDTNALFDEAMQDQLALYLAYNRLVAGNKITGLQTEWVGLQKYSAGEIQASLGEAYNNPQLLLKGV